VSAERAPAPAERHVLASQHAKFPRINSLTSVIQHTYHSASLTTRLTTVATAATLAAVGVGLSAGPAMASTGGNLAATGSARTVLAVGHAGALSLDAASMAAPFGQLAAPAAPVASAAPSVPARTPLSVPAHAAISLGPAPTSGAHGTQSATKTTLAGRAAAPAAPAQRRLPARHAVRPARPFLIFDSVTPSAIPAHHMIATYATGGYAVPAAQVAGRQVLWIDTLGTDPAAAALDVEPGDATPSVAAQWAWHKLSATPDTVARIYTMISEWPAVKAAIAGLPHKMQSHVRYWIADPTGVPHIVPGASATQWYWGKNYDISTANPGFR
jgi:hypothetical protein